MFDVANISVLGLDSEVLFNVIDLPTFAGSKVAAC